MYHLLNTIVLLRLRFQSSLIRVFFFLFFINTTWRSNKCEYDSLADWLEVLVFDFRAKTEASSFVLLLRKNMKVCKCGLGLLGYIHLLSHVITQPLLLLPSSSSPREQQTNPLPYWLFRNKAAKAQAREKVGRYFRMSLSHLHSNPESRRVFVRGH